MRLLEAAPNGSDTPVEERISRTGHSNNYYDAFEHLVHVVDDRVTFIESAS